METSISASVPLEIIVPFPFPLPPKKFRFRSADFRFCFHIFIPFPFFHGKVGKFLLHFHPYPATQLYALYWDNLCIYGRSKYPDGRVGYHAFT
jgi:hypothetical protein